MRFTLQIHWFFPRIVIGNKYFKTLIALCSCPRQRLRSDRDFQHLISALNGSEFKEDFLYCNELSTNAASNRKSHKMKKNICDTNKQFESGTRYISDLKKSIRILSSLFSALRRPTRYEPEAVVYRLQFLLDQAIASNTLLEHQVPI